MKCIEVRENLDAFFDSEIDFFDREKIASHLENCVSCQAEFENLQTVSNSLKQNLPVTVLSAEMDEKVLSAFQQFHSPKQTVETEEKQTKTGWFGIPRFAFAAAFLLLALFSALAFQIGKISAEKIEIQTPEVSENNQKPQPPEIKIVEVVKEKIVEVPVIKEKIITRTVYVEKKEKSQNLLNISSDNNLALNNSIKDGEYLTNTNLEGFKPVSEVKPEITKKDEKR